MIKVFDCRQDNCSQDLAAALPRRSPRRQQRQLLVSSNWRTVEHGGPKESGAAGAGRREEGRMHSITA